MKYCTVCNTKYEDSVSFCPLDGEVLEDDPTSIVNSTLDGQYHIETMLGKGGMGAVYLARHILLGDRVAIKVLPPQMRNNAEWLRRFRREGQAARRFRHPNAVTVYDLRTTAEGMIYMVMEYVEGKTLDAELKARGRFTPGDALNMLEPVMSVLNAAHAQGVVHRDLKPENIMIGKPSTGGEPTVKLLDLGIAKISELAGADSGGGGSTALTVAGQILGTPYYMSPEQWGEPARDNSPEVDGRADIYSLGTVFYELIAGQRPFTGLTLPELRRQHVSVAPKALHEVMSDVPEPFSIAVLKAMSKDRSDRQATAGDLANELRASIGLSAVSLSSSPLPTSSPDVGGPSAPTNIVAPGGATSIDGGAGVPTGSEVSTPTVMTLDSPPLAATSLAQHQPPPPPPQQQPPQQPPAGGFQSPPPMATIATNPNAGATSGFSSSAPPPSFVPAQSAPAQAPPYMPTPAAKPTKKSPIIPIVIVAVLLLGVLGIGGGIFIYSRMGTTSDGGESTPPKTDDGTKDPNGGTAAPKEAMQYWLELDAAANPARVAAVVPLASGQSFKFHFTPTNDGYLYIVGPGDGNVPTTFLTSKPLEQTGVTTNSVKAGENYSFPRGDGNWITLDKKAGEEFYTVIFAKSPVTSLAFLDEEAGKQLSDSEKTELNDFVAPHKANLPPTSVMNENSTEPYVSVKLAKSDGDTLVFDVRIEHK